MPSGHAVLYRNKDLSDVEVRIHKRREPDSPGAKRPRRELDSEATQRGAWDLVEAMPGHRCFFYSLCDYFKAQTLWDQLHASIDFHVEEDEVAACQAFVYFAYHDTLPDGLSANDVAHLLLISDQYQALKCVQACVQQLTNNRSSLADGNIATVVVSVCSVLAKIGAVSPAANTLLEWLLSIDAGVLRRRLYQRLVTVPSSKEQPFTTIQQGPAFDHAVNVLRSLFQDMDQVWGQQQYRDILHVFPAEAVVELLRWDDLHVVSENVVVSAIHEWCSAQPSPRQQAWFRNSPHGPGTDVYQAAAETALLSVVRVSQLSPVFRATVFPNLPWVKRHKDLAAKMLACAALTTATTSSPAPTTTDDADRVPHPPELLAPGCPEAANLLCQPCRPAPGIPPPDCHMTLEWQVSWQELWQAMQQAAREKSPVYVRSAPKWMHGVHTYIGLEVQPMTLPIGALAPLRTLPLFEVVAMANALPAGKVRVGSVAGYWGWDGPCPDGTRLGLHPEMLIRASYNIEFKLRTICDCTLHQAARVVDGEMCPFFSKRGTCENLLALPHIGAEPCSDDEALEQLQHMAMLEHAEVTLLCKVLFDRIC